jgi:hypothetical protein
MTSVNRLYDLLPVVYRQRDAQQDYVLKAILQVISEQVDIVEDDIRQLYENWFIETCEDWVVPYIADLIGYRPVHPLGIGDDASSAAADQFLAPRREVANTIAYRRRKGTLALLNELAVAAGGWPARAVEFHRDVGVTQSIDHLRLKEGRLTDLHDRDALDLAGTPFDRISHRADIRSVDSPYEASRHNLGGVGVFVWRLRAYSVTHSPAYCQEEAGDHCFTFSILGNDLQLFNRPAPDHDRHSVRDIDLPIPIRRHELGERRAVAEHAHISDQYYGEGKSIAIWAPGWEGSSDDKPVSIDRIVAADLTDWKFHPQADQIAVDPELGRIAFASGHEPEHGVWVSYAYGYAADLGGGEYPRPEAVDVRRVRRYEVGASAQFHRIHDAYAQWIKDDTAHAIIEITDSGVYQEQLHVVLGEGRSLQVRAAPGTRPTIYLVDWHASRPDALTVTGEAGSQFTLDGLLITGRGIEVRGNIGALTIRHSTLVPGWAIGRDCRPRRPGEPSLLLRAPRASVAIEHSILGAIQVTPDGKHADPIRVQIADSIVDASSEELPALTAGADALAPAVVTLLRSTIFGRLDVHAIDLAENSIVTGPITVARRQRGCLRFCYVPPGSRTPQRYHCQPDLVDAALDGRLRHEPLPEDDIESLRRAERLRVEPDFLGNRYGRADYARLSRRSAPEILSGASDQAEMGVFHDLFQTQREANLRVRIAEYTPAGVDAGVIWAT